MRFPNPPIGNVSWLGKRTGRTESRSRFPAGVPWYRSRALGTELPRASRAGMRSAKKIQTCPPFPERDRSSAALTPCCRHVSRGTPERVGTPVVPIEVRGKKPTRLVVQQQVYSRPRTSPATTSNGRSRPEVVTDHVIRDRNEQLDSNILRILTRGLWQNAPDPLVGAGRCVAGSPSLRVLPSKRKDIDGGQRRRRRNQHHFRRRIGFRRYQSASGLRRARGHAHHSLDTHELSLSRSARWRSSSASRARDPCAFGFFDVVGHRLTVSPVEAALASVTWRVARAMSLLTALVSR